MSEPPIRIDRADRVARLTLARPARHNAMDEASIAALSQAARDLADDETVAAVVLTGEGASFSAGADLGWMRAQFDASREERIAQALALARMLRDLNELPKPLVGRINGPAYGGGLGLLSVCDVALGVDGARFAFTEVRLGLIPATISPYVLARMGEARARRVFFSGQAFDAREAVELGLLSRCVPAGELDAAVEREIAPYRSLETEAVARAKRLCLDARPPVDDEALRRTAGLLADCWERPATRAAISAFLDGRR